MITKISSAAAGLVFLAGCTYHEQDSIDVAVPYLGLKERQHRTELVEFLGIDPVYTEWCAAFVNSVLESQNIPNLHTIDYEHPLTARGYLDWGLPVNRNDVQRGDVVVFPRGEPWQGHVGFYVRTTTEGYWLILGGNQQDSVSYELRNPRTALAVRRWPKGWNINGTQTAH